MKTRIQLKIADPLAALSALAGQVRREVDAERLKEPEDGFNNSTYRGVREFKRQQHVRPAVVYKRAIPDPKKRWASIRRHNLSLAQPGEMLLGDWLKEQCRLSGHDRTWVLYRLHSGKFPEVTLRKVNLRLVFVKTK